MRQFAQAPGRGLAPAAIVGVLLLAAGCEQQVYRSDSRVGADGRVTRAICQPYSDTPDAVRGATYWQGQRYLADKTARQLDVPIEKLAGSATPDKLSHFAAWGQFESIDNLPDHYRKLIPENVPGVPSATIERDCSQTDYLFVAAHQWRETLTDAVVLDDLRVASGELADLAIDVGDAVLTAALGPDYDTTELHRWAETDGKSCFTDLALTIYELAGRRELDEAPKAAAAFGKVLKRYGLVILDEKGALLKEPLASAAFSKFVQNLLQQRLKRRDGKPIDQQTIGALAEWLGTVQPNPHRFASVTQGYEAAFRSVLEQRFGGEAGLMQKLMPLAARVVGVHFLDGFLGPPRRFVYRLELPGMVTETNGVLQSESQVKWAFDATDAYPAGYEMHCRTLLAKPNVQLRILGRTPLVKREPMLEFIACLDDDKDLLAAVRKCGEQGSTAPLFDYCKSVGATGSLPIATGQSPTRDRAEKVLKLLGLNIDAPQ